MLYKANLPIYYIVILEDIAYISTIDVNIFSRIRHYKARGALINKTLFSLDYKPITNINFENIGFFIPLKGYNTPKLRFLQASPPAYNYSIVVDIPTGPSRPDYQYISDTNTSGLSSSRASKEHRPPSSKASKELRLPSSKASK